MNKELIYYIESEIIPRYVHFDPAHREDHVRMVINTSLELSKYYDVDEDMVYTAAAFHDLGLSKDRKTHHIESGHIVRNDAKLTFWFDAEQIETIAQAVEDHRASSDHEPRSIYGRLLAESDRIIDADTIVRRTVQYGLSHCDESQINDVQWHWRRFLSHMEEKYAEGGYLKLWIPQSKNALSLKEFRSLLKDEKALRQKFDYYYELEQNKL